MELRGVEGWRCGGKGGGGRLFLLGGLALGAVFGGLLRPFGAQDCCARWACSTNDRSRSNIFIVYFMLVADLGGRLGGSRGRNFQLEGSCSPWDFIAFRGVWGGRGPEFLCQFGS
ncbi:unnamed protein product [Ostreobium quekettii]|uniref:Uncharacterized protein n=1 Tax=Ostreobium quekettii TaxID=121088 RepID=A0A8S1J7X6_9CHLO|nr:unnamed protein product [Ostreobium quekettii]